MKVPSKMSLLIVREDAEDKVNCLVDFGLLKS